MENRQQGFHCCAQIAAIYPDWGTIADGAVIAGPFMPT
jgi:hypothetical protein